MKKLLQSFTGILCALLLCGCPYESSVPIDTPKIPVEESLLGQWVTDAESYNEYFITKAGNTQYRIRQKSITGNTAYFTAHLSEVKGTSFLNVYSDSLRVYYLYRIKLSAKEGKCSLMPVSAAISEQFASSLDLRKYVEKNMNLLSFYNGSEQEEFVKLQQ